MLTVRDSKAQGWRVVSVPETGFFFFLTMQRRICLQYSRPRFNPWVGKTPWRRAAHSSILPWRIPWTEEPGRLQSMGSQKRWTWLSSWNSKHFWSLSVGGILVRWPGMEPLHPEVHVQSLNHWTPRNPQSVLVDCIFHIQPCSFHYIKYLLIPKS